MTKCSVFMGSRHSGSFSYCSDPQSSFRDRAKRPSPVFSKGIKLHRRAALTHSHIFRIPVKRGIAMAAMMINGNQTDGETLVTPEVVTIFIILLISQLFLANENFHGMPVAVHFPHRDIGVTAHWLSPLAVTRLYHKPTWETYLYHWMYIPVDG